MKNYLNDCILCPRKCHVNRYLKSGFCNVMNKLIVSKASIFNYEEPCISDNDGSGAIFFSNCNLRCIYCQNYQISSLGYGKVISIKRLSEIMLELEEKHANNINLVSPTPYIPLIIKAIKKAKKNGLHIPIIYNTSGYENADIIKLLDGYIDVYLPDFKYMDNNIAQNYSLCNDYSKYAIFSIDEMVRQTGPCLFNKDGMIEKGVIVRHLVLPGHIDDSKKIIQYLYNKYHDNIYLSIMNQYTPLRKTPYNNLNHALSKKDYDEVIEFTINLGINNCYCQLDDTSSTDFIPNFDLEGVKKTKD